VKIIGCLGTICRVGTIDDVIGGIVRDRETTLDGCKSALKPATFLFPEFSHFLRKDLDCFFHFLNFVLIK